MVLGIHNAMFMQQKWCSVNAVAWDIHWCWDHRWVATQTAAAASWRTLPGSSFSMLVWQILTPMLHISLSEFANIVLLCLVMSGRGWNNKQWHGVIMGKFSRSSINEDDPEDQEEHSDLISKRGPGDKQIKFQVTPRKSDKLRVVQ